jgi:uncharacterized membrane protein YjjP (DUF1212 family)
MQNDEVLDIALEIGYRLLESGAEVSRVEESIRRMVMAYGHSHCDVFAIPSCIIVTAPDHTGVSQTRLRRLHARGTNLGRITLLNSLVRQVCSTTPTAGDIESSLQKIAASPVFGFPVQLLACALIAAAFTLFFGGSWADAAVALVCGALMKLAMHALSRFQTNPFFISLAGSALAASLAFFAVRWNLAGQMDKIIIGTLMNLVPGVAITTSIQDTIAGDLIAGMTKMAEAFLTATAIALGTGIALSLLRLL